VPVTPGGGTSAGKPASFEPSPGPGTSTRRVPRMSKRASRVLMQSLQCRGLEAMPAAADVGMEGWTATRDACRGRSRARRSSRRRAGGDARPSRRRTSQCRDQAPPSAIAPTGGCFGVMSRSRPMIAELSGQETGADRPAAFRRAVRRRRSSRSSRSVLRQRSVPCEVAEAIALEPMRSAVHCDFGASATARAPRRARDRPPEGRMRPS
jgi:hypothetical protein